MQIEDALAVELRNARTSDEMDDIMRQMQKSRDAQAHFVLRIEKGYSDVSISMERSKTCVGALTRNVTPNLDELFSRDQKREVSRSHSIKGESSMDSIYSPF